MTALAASRKLRGHAKPRIAPPLPARSMVADYRAEAERLGIALMEWQQIAGRYITALGSNGRWLYRRVCICVARQNGKTEIIKPRTLLGFRQGRRMLHIAQDRLRPRRSVFEPLADFLTMPENAELYGVKTIRQANGQEQILCANGGSYTILAPTSGGARGGSFDDVFVDEAREFADRRVDGIVRPTIAASPNAQIVYFSSAGHAESPVLNALRDQRDEDSRLAYLEWSAAPDRERDDRHGWAEANPALGITITEETIEDELVSLAAEEFETERLNRWVVSMTPALVDVGSWQRLHQAIGKPERPFMAVSMAPNGTRAAAALAWRQPTGAIAVALTADANGSPINVDRLGEDLQKQAQQFGVRGTGFDDWTDKGLARYLRNAKPIVGKDFANATGTFVRAVDGGRLAWDGSETISDDLAWTARREYDSGGFVAVPSSDEHPIPAAYAAIRAVWMASEPPQPAKSGAFLV